MREMPRKIALAARTRCDAFEQLDSGETAPAGSGTWKSPVMVEREIDWEVSVDAAGREIGHSQSDTILADEHLRIDEAEVIPAPMTLHLVADHQSCEMTVRRVIASIAINEKMKNRAIEEDAFGRRGVECRRTHRHRRRISLRMDER